MSVEDQYFDILQNIEAMIVKMYHQYPDLTDYDVDKAIEALIRTYRGEASGKPETLPRGEFAQAVYDTVKLICNWRLGRTTGDSDTEGLPPIHEPLTTDELNLCFKRIRKSIAKWTKESGRQGYLMYIEQFIG